MELWLAQHQEGVLCPPTPWLLKGQLSPPPEVASCLAFPVCLSLTVPWPPVQAGDTADREGQRQGDQRRPSPRWSEEEEEAARPYPCLWELPHSCDPSVPDLSRLSPARREHPEDKGNKTPLQNATMGKFVLVLKKKKMLFGIT